MENTVSNASNAEEDLGKLTQQQRAVVGSVIQDIKTDPVGRNKASGSHDVSFWHGIRAVDGDAFNLSIYYRYFPKKSKVVILSVATETIHSMH